MVSCMVAADQLLRKIISQVWKTSRACAKCARRHCVLDRITVRRVRISLCFLC